MLAAATGSATNSSNNNTATTMTTMPSSVPSQKQIPIVCPGHTRPLAELQFCETIATAASSGSNGM